MSRVVLFGGAFDPPHLGHQALTRALLAQDGVDAVWWLPTPVHAFAKAMAPWEHRLAMCELALQELAGAALCTVEAELPPPQHTVDTIAHLQQQHPEHVFELAIGSDNLDELERWKDPQRLRRLVALRVFPRAGHAPDASLPEVSSSEVRARLRQGRPVTGLVAPEIAAYIDRHGLYAREVSA